MKTRLTHKIGFRTIISAAIFIAVVLFLIQVTMTNTVQNLEESLIANRLDADIHYIEDIISNGQSEFTTWEIKDGFLYYGNICLGDATQETAYIYPFIVHTQKTGTFSYVFMKCSDEGLTWTGDKETGYMQGHFIRVAGSTRNPNGDSIVGTYMDKQVADILDVEDCQ